MFAVKKATFIAPALAAAALVLAGCGNANHRAATKTSAASHAKATKTSIAKSSKIGHSVADAKPGPVPGQGVKVPTRIPNVVALRKSVVISSCVLSKGVVRVSGTAADPGGSSAAYKLTVFVTNARSTVTGTASTTVHVAAHGNSKWSLRSSVVGQAGRPHCVLVGVGKA
jgi:hypothetical protein